MLKRYFLNKWTVAIVAAGIGFLSATVYFSFRASDFERGFIVRQGKNGFINPILACEIGSKNSFPELEPIQLKVQQTVSNLVGRGDASEISVYVRALNSGRWAGVNDDMKFSPASMYKVVIMIAYFKEAETSPLVLKKTIRYEVSSDNIGTKTTLVGGSYYTVEELINKMIVDSDNEAMNLLIDHAAPSSIESVFKDLNLSISSDVNEKNLDVISARDFSLVFRSLYGASYLNHEMSNRSLDVLTKTAFVEGIVGGVPQDVLVAHKYGSRTVIPTEGLLDNQRAKELHDCGIIYYPEHPYLLCVMTRGTNFDALAKSIRSLSGTIYDEMDKFYKNEKK